MVAVPKHGNGIHDEDLSDNESFHSFDDGEPQPPSTEQTKPAREEVAGPVIERLAPEEEKTLLEESNGLKLSANQLFGKGSFENAIQTYDRALASCPNYLDYELAVLRSNISACHLKLQDWKEAIDSATKGLDSLEHLEPLPRTKTKREGETKEGGEKGENDSATAVEEVDDVVAERLEALQKSGRSYDEVRKLQVKLLTRRAKARTEKTDWSSLQGADEDYRTLLTPKMQIFLTTTDRRQILQASHTLTPKLNAAKDREMAEMMDKLKGLGNSILRPFGLSTSNFQFKQDPNTGGYSMNFNQEPGRS